MTDANRTLAAIDAAISDYRITDDLDVSPDAMRQMPATTHNSDAADESELGEWEIIDAHTRADAIRSGGLVEADTDMAREIGFRIPVALTRAVWEDCVAWTDHDTERTGIVQDETGRLRDVLWMSFLAASRNPNQSEVRVEVLRWPRDERVGIDDDDDVPPVTLIAAVGDGDHGEPVVTIMEPGER